MPHSALQNVPAVIAPMRPLVGLAEVTQDVYLDIMRAAELLKLDIDELLKAHRLSATQYNVLRILRGAGVSGLTCQDIIQRMINRDPDMTRLLDRLERRGLVVRQRSEADRRVVITYLTHEGLRLVEKLDDPVAELHVRQLGYLEEAKLQELRESLRTIRAALARDR